MPFNNSVLFDERVDTVMSWFTDKKTPANLVMLYFEEPDGRGHVYGPESQVVNSFYRRSKRKYENKFLNLKYVILYR